MGHYRLACCIWTALWKVSGRFHVVLLCLFTLASCGFQLRGQQDYPFKRIAIVGGPAPTVARLERMIEAGSDTVVVTRAGQPEVILLLSEERGQSALTLNSRGEVNEYEVTYRLDYSLTSVDGVAPILMGQMMTYGTKVAPSKQQEADVLYLDMQNDAADQLMRRLAAVSNTTRMRHETSIYPSSIVVP